MEIYQVDAFCAGLFSGNPAAVCPLEAWPDDTLLQNIAAENNLAETAYYVQEGDHYHIRWFTPTVEVDLCGHATLATAHVLFAHKGITDRRVVFTSRSGELIVTKNGYQLTLDFPVDELRPIAIPAAVTGWFAAKPVEAFRGKTDYMFVFSGEEEIRHINADLAAIARATEVRGVIVTAPGKTVDFVSRFFGPQSGVPEDPVTGSAHTSLTPYWSARLKKTEMQAQQLSAPMGYLHCKLAGDRVEISGQAKTFFAGTIFLK
jgi:PhzF family phenazine biosynthesis protein